jgi:cell division protein ZapB
MISEFDKLLEKIGHLSELAQALRRENASLRTEMAALADENARMASRMKEAHERVSALLQTMPADREGEETA